MVHKPTSGLTPATNEKETASGTMASDTASPAVMAVTYLVRNEGFENGLERNKFSERDLALSTTLSSCDGGVSLFAPEMREREECSKTPRRGVPEMDTDFPLTAPRLEEDEADCESSLEKRDLGGRLLGNGNAGWANPKQLVHGFEMPMEVIMARQMATNDELDVPVQRWTRRCFA